MMDDDLMFYGHVLAQDRLKFQRKWNQVKDETLLRQAYAEIWTQMVEICGQLHYQLEHECVISLAGAPMV